MTETTKKRAGKWRPGESGNPKGKPQGSGQLQKLRAALADDVPAILKALGIAAKAGDVQAARLILERVLPPLKGVEPCVQLPLPADGSLTAKAEAVVAAVGAGEVTPGQAAQLIAALGSLAKIMEVDELAARVAALEAHRGNA